jgi:hypothetical protein
MLNDLFEVSEKNGRFYVTPVSKQERGRYVIECRSKVEAVQVVLVAKTPHSSPELFQEKGHLPTGETIYTRR